MSRVADDHGVGVARRPRAARLGAREPERGAAPPPAVAAPLPTGRAARRPRRPPAAGTRSPARSAGSRARRCRSRGRACPAGRQERTSSTCSSSAPRAPTRSSCWLVISSLIRPSEKNCSPTTISSTPRISSGRWPIACPSILRRQVQEHSEADRPEREPEPAEKVQRPVAVAADERDGQQVEEAADVALDPVTRTAVLARTVVDRQLGDAVAPVVREHRDEAVQLAVQPQPLHDLGPVGLQPAVEVVQAQAGDAAGDPVEDLRRDAPRERVAPLRLPAADEVEALVELRQQPRDLGRIVLEVGVDRDDDVALGVREPRRERRRLAEVPAQADHPHVVAARCAAGSAPRRSRRSSRRRRRPPPRAGRAAGARTPARRRGAPPSAPRRERGRRPRSRRLSLSAARTVCGGRGRTPDYRGSPAPRARARAPLPAERVPLERAAGRVLAEPARAVVDLPPFPSSAMDGFAVRAADTPGTLPVVFRIAAGRPAPSPLQPGEAMGIATGGVVPDGADAVVPLEYVVDHDNDSRDRPRRPRPARTCGRAAATCAPGTRCRCRYAARAGAARGARGRRRRRGRVRGGAARRRSRDGNRASPAGRAARAGRGLRGQRADPRRSAQVGGRFRRAPGGCRRRRGRPSRGARARARARRARDLGRCLRRPARPRPRDRVRARRRRGLLARRGQAGQAGLVRRARRDARVRPARKPGLVARRLRALRPARGPGAPGPRRPAAPVRAGEARGAAGGTRPATSSSARGRGPATTARSSSSRWRARSRT